MKKLMAVGILFGAMALSAVPALAQTTTNCQVIFNQMHCTTTYAPVYQPPQQHTTCQVIFNQLHCTTY